MLDSKIYTIGLLCVLVEECLSLQVFLDEKHDGHVKNHRSDENSYTLGRMANHNVIIAMLPVGENGTVTAAVAAKSMSTTFPNIRVCIMVGIGGGVRGESDISLGDVVVSTPTFHNGTNYGGVVQYDYGKTVLSGTFQSIRYLNQSPKVCRTAIGALQVHHALYGNQFNESINDILAHNSRIRDKFSRPQNSSNTNCQDEPKIHYGLIASADHFMEDAQTRDILSRELNVLCFEMEAAGLMNDFPYLVVRGICDYADSSWSKAWRGYASMVAAAYAKDLLQHVSPSGVEEEDKLSDILSGMQGGIQRLVSHQCDETLAQRLRWLSEADYAVDQNKFWRTRQEGTCMWLLSRPEFKYWKKTPGQVLYGPGIPGAGKSHTTATLINNLQRQSQNDSRIALAYIYCNFQRHEEQVAEDILANILKQLVNNRPDLQHGIADLYEDHKSRKSRPNLSEIATLLNSLLPNFSRTFLIVDALDECNEQYGSRLRLLWELRGLQDRFSVNLFITARKDTVDLFHFFRNIQLIEIRATDDDISCYLQAQTYRLPKHFMEIQGFQSEICNQIIVAAQGMFLLAHLAFEDLLTKTSVKDARMTLATLPSGSQAYKKAYEIAMRRVTEQDDSRHCLAMRTFSLTSYARRPITIMELQHALAVQDNRSPLDIEALIPITTILTACCGLVTMDTESDIIRPVHYTTKQFFDMHKQTWFARAELDLAKICVRYLSMDEFALGRCKLAHLWQRLSKYELYDYAACNWGHHVTQIQALWSDVRQSQALWNEVLMFLQCFKKADASSQPLMLHHLYPDPSGNHNVSLAEPESTTSIKDFTEEAADSPHDVTGLHLAAYFGLESAIQWLLHQGHYTDQVDEMDQTPLSYASTNGHVGVVQLLIEHGAQKEWKDYMGQTPLSRAAAHGHTQTVKLLIQYGAEIDTISDGDGDLQSPLMFAAASGHAQAVEVLLEHRADTDLQDIAGHTAMTNAITGGHDYIVKLLLIAGADIDLYDNYRRTPLSHAASLGHFGIAQQLVESGSNCNSQDSSGRSPISHAIQNGHLGIVELLLANGAKPNLTETAGDKNGW